MVFLFIRENASYIGGERRGELRHIGKSRSLRARRSYFAWLAGGEVSRCPRPNFLRTFHDLDDGWYLRLPDTWRDRIYITRSVSFGEADVTFYIRATQEPFLRISALTGSGREMRSVRGERFVLNRQSECIYTGELLDANHTWDAGLTEDAVRAGFSLILREWLPSDS